MSDLKLSLDRLLKKINLHEATEANKRIATAIITEIFKEIEDGNKKIYNSREN